MQIAESKIIWEYIGNVINAYNVVDAYNVIDGQNFSLS
jgi:hypothetical protein